MRLFCEKVVASIHVDESNGHIRLIELLRDIVRKHPGKVPINICLIYPDKRKIIVEPDQEFNVEPTADFIATAESVLSKNSLRMVFRESIFKASPRDRYRVRGRQTN